MRCQICDKEVKKLRYLIISNIDWYGEVCNECYKEYEEIFEVGIYKGEINASQKETRKSRV